MSLGKDITDGFEESLNKAKDIASKFIDDSVEAWGNWRDGDPFPVVEFEKFDYCKKQAETIINSCYNSFSNGTIKIPLIAGVYLAGDYKSSAPAICSWKSGSSTQSHVDNVVSALKNMTPELGVEFSPTSAELNLAVAITDEIHTMVTSGTISANGVSGILTIPSTPPVTSTVVINVKGSLSGSSAMLVTSLSAAFKFSSNELVGDAIGNAVKSYCALLTGSVTGQAEASSCSGTGLLFDIV